MPILFFSCRWRRFRMIFALHSPDLSGFQPGLLRGPAPMPICWLAAAEPLGLAEARHVRGRRRQVSPQRRRRLAGAPFLARRACTLTTRPHTCFLSRAHSRALSIRLGRWAGRHATAEASMGMVRRADGRHASSRPIAPIRPAFSPPCAQLR